MVVSLVPWGVILVTLDSLIHPELASSEFAGDSVREAGWERWWAWGGCGGGADCVGN